MFHIPLPRLTTSQARHSFGKLKFPSSQSSCKRVSGSLLTLATSVAEVSKKQTLLVRNVVPLAKGDSFFKLLLFIEWSIAWLVRIKLLDKRRQ